MTVKLVGLVARNPSGSLASEVMNAFFRDQGLDFHYQSFSVDPPQFKEAFEGLLVLSRVGFHIGPPFRGTALRFLHKLSKEVEFVGAVDSVAFRQGVDTGYNVQFRAVSVFIEEAQIPVNGADCMVIGAGAAGSACVYAFLKAGARSVFIANKTVQRAEVLASRYQPYFKARLVPVMLSEEETSQVLPECQVVMHATPVGSPELPQIYPKVVYSKIRPNAHVIDLVYRPEHTPFLVRASRFTNHIHSGLRVFGLSLALSWKLWSGQSGLGAIWRILKEMT